jgi:hypothetical protein
VKVVYIYSNIPEAIERLLELAYANSKNSVRLQKLALFISQG